MTQSFGLTLLHRHFNLKEHETLVETNGTSTPGGLQDTSIIPGRIGKYGGSIKPFSWIVVNGRLVPYEYYFDRSPATKSSPELGTAFVEDLSAILETHKLSNDLKFHLLGDVSQRQLEVTEGAANVAFPLDNGALPSTDNSDNYIEATW
ncbi:hypothetical protein BDV23DRAFT_180421 [Aspergillus alliaceus]|uniref:Uncharacterized protein n=1 Tax=Petromyces alliaceus TaxID=209559 RepID=A0A5N7CIV6_PETAA|nr:hypothetical protein BDV23DRAFT_180421 [Aspergillus alliaceus]